MNMFTLKLVLINLQKLALIDVRSQLENHENGRIQLHAVVRSNAK